MSATIQSRSGIRRIGFVVALLGSIAAMPAFAEGNTATTMSPPAPNASSSAPQAEASLPENAETSTYNLAGAQLGSKPVAPTAAATRASSD